MKGAQLSRSVSVVVPVYNGEGTVRELVKRLMPAMEQVAALCEVVLVNDGSRDESWRAIADLCGRDPRVRGINLARNYGQHSALLCGIRAARYETIVTIDDDLQNPPEEIFKLLDKLDDGYDVVYGTPAVETHGLWRDLASRITKIALQSAVGAETARKVSALRAFRASAREAFGDFRGPFVSIDVLLTWGACRFAAVTVAHHARTIGTSNYTFRKLVTHALNMMTGFSTLPLQLASVTGFAFTLFGVAVLIYVVGRYVLQGTSVPGFPFLASVIAIFSGAQLFALGVIGEYLARMHFRTMDKPAYVVRESR